MGDPGPKTLCSPPLQPSAMTASAQFKQQQQQRRQLRQRRLPQQQLLLTAAAAAGGPCGPACQARQQAALLALFEATEGSHWFNSSGWSTPNSSQLCTWYGVFCCADTWSITTGTMGGRNCSTSYGVTALLLNGNNLNGTLPSEAMLALSDSLQSLILNTNHLVGSIPEFLAPGNISALQYLDLHSNSLSGPVPSGVGAYTDLLWLDLNNNQLTGPPPSWMLSHPSLKGIQLGTNHLSGTIQVPTILPQRESLSVGGGGTGWVGENKSLALVYLSAMRGYVWPMSLLWVARDAEFVGGGMLIAVIVLNE